MSGGTRRGLPGFVHLHCHSPYSFLDGAVPLEEMVARAAMWEMPAIALTDHDTIAGLPAFHRWAAAYGVKPVSGAEVTLEDGSHLTVLAETREGYANLCRLLTLAYGGAAYLGEALWPGQGADRGAADWAEREADPDTGGKAERARGLCIARNPACDPARAQADLRRRPRLPEAALLACGRGLIVLSGCRRGRLCRHILARRFDVAEQLARRYQQAFPGAFFIELQGDDYPHTDWLNEALAELAGRLGIPLVATSNVHHLTPEQFPVYDLLTCIRLRIDVHTPHPERPLNPARWLHGPDEAARRFAKYPEAIANTLRIAERCEVALRLGASLFPAYPLPPGERDAAGYLRKLVDRGATERYGKVDAPLRQRLDHELSIIEQLGYADYFLVVWDISDFARRRGIRFAGRGSAADSAVAYCLHITDVDAAGRGLLFERFMSLERAEKPDIDIDFDSRRRDEVVDYVYRKYGRQHVARVATHQTFRGRSAIREAGAALALPEPLLDALAKRVPWMAHADRLEVLLSRVPELRAFARYREQLAWLWQLARAVAGFPRHFGMHLGGVVISARPLWETTSLQPSAKGEWMTPFDKHAAEDVGLVKLDLLSLRTMAAIEDAVKLSGRRGPPLDYEAIPLDDPETFAMIRTGETIGVFQLESPAQRALQARLGADRLEDIVASVALIRPGPIKGNMVDPFLRRRRGEEPVSYLHPKLERILGKTYGVVLFQEQVIEIATAIANFTPGEADELRRVMSRARSAEEMEKIGRRFLEKAEAAGVASDVAATIFSYIQSYASYGFCEAHAAAFATTAYKTAYLVRHYPAEFFAAVLNQYPMGCYPVHVICAEARRRGVPVLGLDVNRSEWGCTVEPVGETGGAGAAGGAGVPGDAGAPAYGVAIRLGFGLLKGFRREVAEELCEERDRHGPFTSVADCLRRVRSFDGLSAERLIRAGAFDGVAPKRRRWLLWRLPEWLELRGGVLPGPLGEVAVGAAVADAEPADQGAVADLPLAVKLADEYNLLGVGISSHWMNLLRPELAASGYRTVREVLEWPDGAFVRTAGLLIRPHRPPTKSGRTVVFFTLEDETGLVDATMFEPVYRACGAVVFTPYGRLLGVEGRVERRGGSRAQIVVSRVWPLAGEPADDDFGEMLQENRSSARRVEF